MTLYETIFKRRSVREYNDRTMDASTLDEIKNYLEQEKNILGQEVHFEFVERDKLKGGKAPHAVLAFGADSDASKVNIGYRLEELDLYLQSVGIGSLWCGMASPIESREDYRILLGFGNTDVAYRNSEKDFKRKNMSEISNADNSITRAARLAPSAVNFQPWKIEVTEGKVRTRVNVRGIAKFIPGKLYAFDLGITTKFIEIALQEEGKRIDDIQLAGEGKNVMVDVLFS